MIRFFRAFLWLRWRVFINTLKGGSDTVTRVARWGQTVVVVVVPLLFVPAALGLGVAAVFAGKHLGTPGTESDFAVIPARIALGIITLIVSLAPLVRSIHGSTTGRSRFLLLPIPRSALHLCETASSLSDPWLFLMLPPLLLLPVGWFVWGSATASLVVLAAGLILLLTLTTVSALAAFLAHLLLRDRRRAERMAMVVILLIVVLSFLPMAFESNWAEQDKQTRKETRQHARAKRLSILRAMSPVTWVIPSELYSKTLQRAHDGRTMASLLPLGALALIGTALFLTSARVHRRLLDSPESNSPRRGRGGALEFRARRLPGLSRAASAVAWATARMAMRTVKGKAAVITTPLAVGILSFALSRRWEGVDFAGMHVGASSAGLLIALVLPLLSFQPILLNTYAVDRAGLTLQFLIPASDQDLVCGKIAGGALLTAMATVPGLILVALITREGPLALWLAVILGSIATYLVLGPVFAMLSALFPKAADLSSLGTKGNCNQLAGLLATLLIPAMLSPVVILMLAGQFLWGNLYAGVALVAGWVVVAALLTFPLTQMAAALLARRREQVGLVAQIR